MNRVRVVCILAFLLVVGPLVGRSPAPARADTVQWTAAGTLSAARSGHTATLLDDGRVLVTGGFNDTTTFAAVDLYQPATNSWSVSDPLNTPRAAHTATLLLDGTVLVVGGVNDGTTLATVELFDPATGAWTTVAPLATARHSHTASLLPDGSVLVVGGTDAGGAILASTERYDPGNGIWTPAAGMRHARRFHTATVAGTGDLIAVGGQSNVLPINSVERYDYARDVWDDLPALARPRYDHAAAPLADGRLFVVGGVSGPGSGDYEASVEVYDPAGNAWSPAAPIPFTRAEHSATTLTDGSVLVAGGFSPANGLISDSQRYLPTSNTWEYSGQLSAGRQSHVATLLADGDVLVTGGQGGAPLASVERFPQNDPPLARAATHGLRLGTLGLDTIPVGVSWPSAIDTDAITAYQVQRQVNRAAWTDIPLTTPTSQSAMLQLTPATNVRFRVRATDSFGLTGSFAVSPERQLELRQEQGSGIRYAGNWRLLESPALSGGGTRYATATGASATITFDGTSVAWVTGKGPGRGRARVMLDDVTVATIDLYAPTTRARQIVFARNGLSSGSHTLTIVALGTKSGASTGTRVDLDAVVVLR